MPRYYLAYGSNLNMEQMSWRCPGARPIGETVLEGYEMTFRSHNTRGGVANVEPKEGSKVKAFVFSITPSDEEALDRYEGFPWLYVKEMIKVPVNGKIINAMVYIMAPGYQKARPRADYVETITQGYIDCGWKSSEFEEWVKPYIPTTLIDFDLDAVREQIIFIRDTGLTNMFDRIMVQSLALDYGFDDLADFIDIYPGKYSKFILRGKFE